MYMAATWSSENSQDQGMQNSSQLQIQAHEVILLINEVDNSSSTQEITFKLKIDKENLVTELIQSIRCITQLFKKCKPAKNMDFVWKILDTGDTLCFDFDIIKVDDGASNYQHKTSRLHHLPRPLASNNTSKSHQYQHDKSSNSCELFTLPTVLTENDSMDILQKSSDLVDSAHQVLLKSKQLRNLSSENGQTSMKSLRFQLNQAIIEFDTSTTNLLEDMNNSYVKRQLCQDGRSLIESIQNMKEFLKIQNKSTPIKYTSVKDSHHSKLSDLKKNEKHQPVNPISYECFEEKAKCLQSLTKFKDIADFEKEVNSIVEYEESLQTFIHDIKERDGCHEDTDILLGNAMCKTRQLIRYAREVSTKYSPTVEDCETLKILSQDWSKSQAVLADNIKKQLEPWTSVADLLFKPSNVGGKMPTEFDGVMSNFKSINKDIGILIGECRKLETDNAQEHVASHQIKLKNLSMELKEYSSKVLQLAKLNLLGDVEANEWLTFGLWLFRWSNTVQQIFHHLDVLTGYPHSTPEDVTRNHLKLVSLAKQNMQSCTNLEVRDKIWKAVEELEARYFEVMPYNDKENKLISSGHHALLIQQWKLKAHILSNVIEESVCYLAKPIDALISYAYNETNNLPTNPLLLSCDENNNNIKYNFTDYKDIFLKKMERVHIHACLAVEKTASRDVVHRVIETSDQLKEASESILEACRKNQADSSFLVDPSLHVLRLQWLSSAAYLLYALRKVPEVKFTAISAIVHHLHSAFDVSSSDKFLDILAENSQVPLPVVNNAFSIHQSEIYKNAIDSELDSVYGTLADYTESEGVSDAIIRIQTGDYQPHDDHSHEDHNDHSRYFMDNWLQEQQNIGHKSKTSLAANTPKVVQPPLVSPKPKCKLVSQAHSNSKISADINYLNESENDHVNSFDDESFQEPTSKSIAAAAHILHREADKWEDENNSIIQVVKLMANQMFQMAEFSKGRGDLKSKDDLIFTAKAIAANAKNVAKFASIITEQCDDESCQVDLLHFVELVPTISTQLRIVASVKAVTTDDETADIMLITNAENLMKAVIGTLKSAESASVKIASAGVQAQNSAVHQSHKLAFQWKRKVRLKRAMDALVAPRDELGLRLSRGATPLPSLTDLVST